MPEGEVLIRRQSERGQAAGQFLRGLPHGVQGGAVQIDGRSVAQLRDSDAQGRPLLPWRGCRRLAADELFVLSETSPASFDSRYFGPITRERVIGRARPLWIWLPDEASAEH